MKRLVAAIAAFLMCSTAALAQYSPPGGGPYQGSTVAPGANGNVMTSNGTAWTSAAPSGGGGGSPFAPAGFANVSTFNAWYDLAIAPAGDYVYVGGVLASNSHGAIAKVKVSDGSVAGTVDLGAATQPSDLAVSPDGAAVYGIDKASPTTWWKIATSGMSITHTSTLATGVAVSTTQQFDLSPDGTIYAYVSGTVDHKVYEINTSTYAVTSVTVGHSDGGTAATSAVCWYNGSSANFKVAYNGIADVDEYDAGVYASTVSTGAGGTPAFNAMRSGINGNFFIADSGTNKEIITVTAGSPTINPIVGIPRALAVDTLSIQATCEALDNCFVVTNSIAYLVNPVDGIFGAVSIPGVLVDDGLTGLAVAPDGSQTLYTLSGCTAPTVWSIPFLQVNPQPSTAGNIQTSNGKGSWTSAAPYSTSGYSGTGTIGGGGTVTITTGVATTGSIINLMSTSATPHAMSVTTRNNGSFVVTGTAADTFDYVIVKP